MPQISDRGSRRQPQSRARRLGAAVTLWAWLLGGCASAPELIPLEYIGADDWLQRQSALRQVRDWSLDGRVSVSTEDRGWYAGLDWRQSGPDYHLELRGPLGQGRLWIDGNDDSVRAVAGDGTVHNGETPEQLLAQAYGWQLPISGLRYWVRGLPDPALAIEEIGLDSLGRLALLRQGGWHIVFPAYQDRPGVDLPEKITVEGYGLRLRLVIDQWVLA